MGSREQAEDLLQTALARTCVRWGSIRDKGAADAYVRRILVNLAQGEWRRRGRELPVDRIPDAGHDHLGMRADHLALWQAIGRLPTRMRATLVLRYYEDLSIEETARELCCSTGAVKSQTHHAIARLRAALPALELTQELS